MSFCIKKRVLDWILEGYSIYLRSVVILIRRFFFLTNTFIAEETSPNWGNKTKQTNKNTKRKKKKTTTSGSGYFLNPPLLDLWTFSHLTPHLFIEQTFTAFFVGGTKDKSGDAIPDKIPFFKKEPSLVGEMVYEVLIQLINGRTRIWT